MINNQIEIVQKIAETIKTTWDFTVVSFEIDDDESTDCISFIQENGTEKEYILPFPLFELFKNLRKNMKENWYSVILEIHNSGKYQFYFDYDKPKRLTGTFTPESQLENYQVKLRL